MSYEADRLIESKCSTSGPGGELLSKSFVYEGNQLVEIKGKGGESSRRNS